MSDQSNVSQEPRDAGSDGEARRRFLERCGKFAAVTPPAIALMLTMPERGYAQFMSCGHHH